jgi:hypothetical protein
VFAAGTRDESNSGPINEADYTYWKTNFGSSWEDAGVGSGSLTTGAAIATALPSLDAGADAMWDPGGRSSRSSGVSGRNATTREAAVDRLFATRAAARAIRQRVDNQEVWKPHVQMGWKPDIRRQEGSVVVQRNLTICNKDKGR